MPSHATKPAAKHSPQHDTVNTLRRLITAPSVTPDDAGTIEYLSQRLSALGFECTPLDCNGVRNLVARRQFGPGPVMAFAGHVDVVPANPRGWIAHPFAAAVIDDVIYGRGAADMKGGVAAMLSATERLCEQTQHCQGTLFWLITSDEEGEAEYGSKIMAEYLAQQGVTLDACLVGEPTSHQQVGDTIKNGRRGAISGRIQIQGKAGHVAYPEQTINAAHIAGELVNELANISWWKDVLGSQTSLQVTGLTVPDIVDNLVPASCEITFNVRYSHAYKSREIYQIVAQALAPWGDHVNVQWERPCESYYTGSREAACFLSLVEQAIFRVRGQFPALSTAGGTSDGRFFASNETQVIECGVKNDSIHQVNEHVSVADLHAIEEIYTAVLTDYFGV
ncbi:MULTISPECIES: succinyl-diaminopimelate desuccinylase [unclassified Pseudoalteromonas]|uniref:succinyl-diaminopimelate desuccinylase n=1 Tax=unclassified Pseudoalteromonas TaxID=194690 RepID=UPI002096CE95|nr:succinyl-diaminopimelate desuccinylase [Pseudoalteromonas sp. XMcav2-N]MCO7190299.1 succinyl-diaminopimelate desuccinylase [Pseudoalteromonas sp. XMcav2-N]